MFTVLLALLLQAAAPVEQHPTITIPLKPQDAAIYQKRPQEIERHLIFTYLPPPNILAICKGQPTASGYVGSVSPAGVVYTWTSINCPKGNQ